MKKLEVSKRIDKLIKSKKLKKIIIKKNEL